MVVYIWGCVDENFSPQDEEPCFCFARQNFVLFGQQYICIYTGVSATQFPVKSHYSSNKHTLTLSLFLSCTDTKTHIPRHPRTRTQECRPLIFTKNSLFIKYYKHHPEITITLSSSLNIITHTFPTTKQLKNNSILQEKDIVHKKVRTKNKKQHHMHTFAVARRKCSPINLFFILYVLMKN